MANIETHLNNIKNALYGRDVRSSIHDSISSINEKAESVKGRQQHLESTFDQLIINNGNSNAEIVDARTGENGRAYSNLGKRLDSLDSQLEGIEEKINTSINVVEFMADGVDFAQAFQACIDYCKNNNCNKIEFPNNKTFEVSKTIRIPLEIEEINFNNCTLIPRINGEFANNFMIAYNSNEDVTDSNSWIGYSALKMSNVVFANDHTIKNMKGMFVGAKARIENIESRLMYNTFTYSVQYIDQHELRNVLLWDHQGDGFPIDISSKGDFKPKGDNFLIEDVEIGYFTDPSSSNNCIRIKGGNNVKIDRLINGKCHFEGCFVNLSRVHMEWGFIKFVNSCFSIKDSYFQHNNLEQHPYCIAILSNNGTSNPGSIENVHFSYDYWSNIKHERKVNPEIVISNDYGSPIHIKNISCGSYEFNGTKHSARVGILDENLNIVKTEIDNMDLVSHDSIINGFGVISLPNIVQTLPADYFIKVEKKRVKNSTDKVIDGVVKEHFTKWKENTGKFTYHVSYANSVKNRIGIKNTQTFDVYMNEGEEGSVVIRFNKAHLDTIKAGYLIVTRILNDGEWYSIATIPISDTNCEFVDDGYMIGFVPWYGIVKEDISHEWNDFYNTQISSRGKVVACGYDKPRIGNWNKFDEIICTDPNKNIYKWLCVEGGYPGAWKAVNFA